VIDVEVGAADGGGANANENVGSAKCGNGNGLELRACFRAHLAQGFHCKVRLRR